MPTRELKVDIANGSELVAGNDVREGGYLIGIVSSLKPVTMENGQTGAQLTLKLNKSYGDVPIDSQRLDPAAVGARAQVPRPAQGRPQATCSSTARRCRSRRPTCRSSSTTCSRCSTPTTRGAVQENLDRVRRHARLARLGAQRHDRQSAGAVRAPRPGRPLPVGPEHRADPLLQRAELVHGRGGAGGAGQRGAVRKDGDDVRGDRPQPGRPEGDDRRVALDASRSRPSRSPPSSRC